MARKPKHEEHLNAEAWAIPYGDLITLLLAFFVVMYSMSSVNEGKYRILSDSLVAAFRGAPRTISPITSTKESSRGTQLAGVRPTALLKLRDPRPEPTGPAGRGGASGPPATPPLARMAQQVRFALPGMIDGRQVEVRQSDRQLEVEIKADILFSSGQAELAPAALPVIDQLAVILAPFPHMVRVEGHTDDLPIRTAAYPSNWELSSARAAHVVRQLTNHGVSAERLQVAGYGAQRPIGDNRAAAGRNANRRVVVVVMEPAGAPAPAPATATVAAPVPSSAPGPAAAAAPAASAASSAAPSGVATVVKNP